LEESGMYVAEYLTDLPPRRLLEAKLHEAIRLAREHIAVREGISDQCSKTYSDVAVKM
ncbi:MAG: hypothetical protein GWP10_08290, partial [Nitrospiraceae bacterium]|nr:hypothetical protein [Nitrospiraceae bacterium]